MFNDLPEAVIAVPTVWVGGFPDSGTVEVQKDGLVISTAVAGQVGIEWEDLLDVIGHPEVQNRLAEAARARGE